MGLDLKIFCVRGSSDVITFLCLYRCDTSLCLSTAPFLCTKRKSSLIHFLFNNPAATYTTTSVIYTTDHLYKMPSYMYIEYTGRRIADKFGEHLRSVEVTINNAYFIWIWIFSPPGRTFQPSGPQLFQLHVVVCDSNNSN